MNYVAKIRLINGFSGTPAPGPGFPVNVNG